ncbi:MAG: choice-of-anchor Q domain-containing protein, partial [Luteolibacter sp.]
IYSSGSGSGSSAILTLSDCTLSDNSSFYGGAGIYSIGHDQGNATLTLSACTLSGNSVTNGSGGGIYSHGGSAGNTTATLSACNLSGNSATSDGGGIYNFGFGSSGRAALTLNACTLSGNLATRAGGGIYNNGATSGRATLILNTSTLSGNSATYGGGISSESGSAGNATITLNACTISGNSITTSSGSGVFSQAASGNATFTLTNSIIAGNGNGSEFVNSNGTISALGVNLLGNLTGSGLVAGPNVIVATDPMLAPLGNYGGPTQTVPPLPGSPAIDAAGTIDPGGTDQRGFPRFLNGALDIGAVEGAQGPVYATLWPTDDDFDGISYGVEHALGTDPDTSDPGNPANLTAPSFNGSGHATFAFGRNPTAEPHTIWILERSTTLASGSFVEIFRFDGPTATPTNQPGITSIPNATSFSVTDTNPPVGKAFYRFKAIYVP